MKNAVMALALILLTTAWVNHTHRYQMIELNYVSQACEMMGKLTVSWYIDWPPKGPRQSVQGARVETDIGPDRRCGIAVFMPTRSNDNGQVAATIFGLARGDTTVSQYKSGQ